MARSAWWIPILQMAWLVLQTDSEHSGESASEGTELPHTLTFDAGQIAVLYCSFSDVGDKTVTWRKLPNRNPLTIGTDTWVKDPRIHAEHVPNSRQWTLVIEKVNLTDAGIYECKVSARGEQFQQRVELKVKALPARRYPRIEISGRNYIRQGEAIQLQCNATMVDISVDNLEWLKDGRPLHEVVKSARMKVFTSVSLSPELVGTISSSLQINQSRISDSGVYVCRSTERSQLAGVKLEVKADALNSKRADNIQHYTGSASGQPPFHSAQALLVAVTLTLFLGWTRDVR